jgi:hypothetical protein
MSKHKGLLRIFSSLTKAQPTFKISPLEDPTPRQKNLLDAWLKQAGRRRGPDPPGGIIRSGASPRD